MVNTNEALSLQFLPGDQRLCVVWTETADPNTAIIADAPYSLVARTPDSSQLLIQLQGIDQLDDQEFQAPIAAFIHLADITKPQDSLLPIVHISRLEPVGTNVLMAFSTPDRDTIVPLPLLDSASESI